MTAAQLRDHIESLRDKWQRAVDLGQGRAVKLQQLLLDAEADLAALEEAARNPPPAPEPKPVRAAPPPPPQPERPRLKSIPFKEYDVVKGPQLKGPWGGTRWVGKHG